MPLIRPAVAPTVPRIRRLKPRSGAAPAVWPVSLPVRESDGPVPGAVPRDDAPPPRMSVVVPTCGRPELLRRCLQALLIQSVEPEGFEIIVVDDGHDEPTRTLVEWFAHFTRAPQVRYLRPAAGKGPAVARNTGWRAARAPLIAFTDDDTVPAPDWLRRGEQAFAEATGPVVAVSGRVQVPRVNGRDARPSDHELMTRGLESAEFVTANAFVRKRALEDVNGFDERFTRAWREDSDLQFRLLALGGRIVRCEDAVVQHPVRPERWGVCLRQQRNTYFDALLFKKHPGPYRERIRRVPPWDYYAIVGLALAAPALGAAGRVQAGGLAGLGALLLVLRLAGRRLAGTSLRPAHVAEMVATSALIPFLSVYWRLRGAMRFKVLFL